MRAQPSSPTIRLRPLLRTAVALGISALLLFPLYWMLNASLQPGGSSLPDDLLPLEPTLAGYRRAVSDQGRALLVSIVVAVGTALGTAVIATPAAFALSRAGTRWRSGALLLLLLTQMVPGIVVATALYPAYRGVGMLNTVHGLVLANTATTLPFAVLLLGSSMRALPASVFEAARVDGASTLRVLLSIAAPMSRNGIVTVSLFGFLFAWSDFLLAVTLTTDNEVQPITIGIYRYLGLDVANWNAVMATAVLSALPATVLLILAQRSIATGIHQGAVK
ncbi:MAG: carbohydrate ABC transporter permease [Dermatophilaceae bacterium]